MIANISIAKMTEILTKLLQKEKISKQKFDQRFYNVNVHKLINLFIIVNGFS